MGDAYKLARSFPDAAAQFCYAVLGNNTVNYVLERGDRRAGMKLRHDAGDRLVGGCVECSTIKDWPCSERIAPRAKSGWPPEDDQYSLPRDSEAHWPRKSTSRVALMAPKLFSPATLPSSLVWSTGQNSTPGFSSTNLYRRLLPSALLVMALFPWLHLRVPVTIPFSIRS
jgi:hypothetical protein